MIAIQDSVKPLTDLETLLTMEMTMSKDKTYEAWEFMKEHIIIIPVGFPPPEKSGGEE
jgi:hypothetical protein